MEKENPNTRKVKCVSCFKIIKATDSFLEEDGSYYCELCYDEYLEIQEKS